MTCSLLFMIFSSSHSVSGCSYQPEATLWRQIWTQAMKFQQEKNFVRFLPKKQCCEFPLRQEHARERQLHAKSASMNLLQFNAEVLWRSNYRNYRYRRQRQRSWRYNPRWGLPWISRFVLLLTVLFVALVHLLSYWEQQMTLVLGCSSEAANAHCEPSVPVARWMPRERGMPSKGGSGLSWFSMSPVQYAYSTVGGGSQALIARDAFRTKGWCFVSASRYPLKLVRRLSCLSFLEFAHASILRFLASNELAKQLLLSHLGDVTSTLRVSVDGLPQALSAAGLPKMAKFQNLEWSFTYD